MRLLNYKIEISVFLAGAILMALEIVGARLLIPQYGDTVYLWGSIIGVFLLSLSIGYYLGGKLADKIPEFYLLSVIFMIVGVFIFIIPFTYIYIVNFFQDLSIIYATLASVTLIFIIPGILLGMVSPFALKLKVKDLHEIGKLSGKLYSIATLGSVLGTFLTTFVFIFFLPINTIFLCLSVLSFIIAAVMFKRNIPFVILAIAIISMISLNIEGVKSYQLQENISVKAPKYYSEKGVNVTIESLYGQISVKDDDNYIRSLLINEGIMSQMDLRDESKTVAGWEYIDCMTEIPFVFNPNTKNVLAMGLGGGIFQKNIHRKYGVLVDTVEINEKVVELAEKYFNVKTSDTFRIYINDARVFLQKNLTKYDLIAVDVFHFDPGSGYKIPFHLATQEFFNLVKDHLNPEGLLVMNFVCDSKDSTFCQSEYKTINSVFNSVYVFDCGTTVFVASKNHNFTIDESKKLMLQNKLLDSYYEMNMTDKSIILTDAFSPINPFKKQLKVE